MKTFAGVSQDFFVNVSMEVGLFMTGLMGNLI